MSEWIDKPNEPGVWWRKYKEDVFITRIGYFYDALDEDIPCIDINIKTGDMEKFEFGDFVEANRCRKVSPPK